MDVSFGVGWLSTEIENCRLRTMTLSDNCCVNQDGVVHASRLFVYNNVPSFDAVVRKLVHSFWCSLCKSDNMLIKAVLSSDIYFQSLLFQRWRSILF